MPKVFLSEKQVSSSSWWSCDGLYTKGIENPRIRLFLPNTFGTFSIHYSDALVAVLADEPDADEWTVTQINQRKADLIKVKGTKRVLNVEKIEKVTHKVQCPPKAMQLNKAQKSIISFSNNDY